MEADCLHILDKPSISKEIFLIYLLYHMIYLVYQIFDIDIVKPSISKLYLIHQVF